MEGGVMNKTLGVLLAVVAGAIIFVIAKESRHSAPPPSAASVADQVEEGFKLAAARIRPTLPKKLDDATTLWDVSSRGMVLTYRYSVDRDNYELLPNSMQVAQRATTRLVCNTQDMKSAMKAGAVYEYSYSDEKANSLGGFVVTAADCE
jgi:hypothetical protein